MSFRRGFRQGLDKGLNRPTFTGYDGFGRDAMPIYNTKATHAFYNLRTATAVGRILLTCGRTLWHVIVFIAMLAPLVFITLIFLLGIWTVFANAADEDLPAVAHLRIIDGDTVVIDGQEMRLFGIDAPEDDQPGGGDASTALSYMLTTDDASLTSFTSHGTDRYGRLLVTFAHINCAMVRQGHAWAYIQYSRMCEEEEKLARKNGNGVFSSADAVPPWDWRQGIRTPQPLAQVMQTAISGSSAAGGELPFIPGTCKSLTTKGYGNFKLGDANYTKKRDADRDGIACEMQ